MGKVLICLLLAGAPAAAAAPGAETPPAFALAGTRGERISLADSLGKKWVVLNFWARWCVSCREEIPQLAGLMKQPGADKAVFIGINVGDTADKAARFAEKYAYPYPVALDGDKAVAKSYGVLGLPVTVIISKEGKIVFRGARPPADFSFKGK